MWWQSGGLGVLVVAECWLVVRYGGGGLQVGVVVVMWWCRDGGVVVVEWEC